MQKPRKKFRKSARISSMSYWRKMKTVDEAITGKNTYRVRHDEPIDAGFSSIIQLMGIQLAQLSVRSQIGPG